MGLLFSYSLLILVIAAASQADWDRKQFLWENPKGNPFSFCHLPPKHHEIAFIISYSAGKGPKDCRLLCISFMGFGENIQQNDQNKEKESFL
jgi:hypothetical protein